ncbi:MAG TPA: hypothetical protein VK511_04710 [Gemmatimonadaceae bacterium]|nr:hypothetical protein [Gemmatimonadaceae bacterium]
MVSSDDFIVRVGRRWSAAIGVLLLSLAVVGSGIARDDPRIARIRKWYAATEKALPSNRVVRRDLAGLSSHGAVLTAYFAGDTIKKLNGVAYQENGKSTDDLYLRNDTVYFVSYIVGKYSLSMDGRITHRVQYRMYYDGDTLIRWIDTTGKDLPVKTDAANAQVKRDHEMARILMECAKITGQTQSCDIESGDSVR